MGNIIPHLNSLLMINIVLLGAGKLGSRHLQALSRLKIKNTKLHIIDKSSQSISIAKERLGDEIKNKNILSIDFYRKLDDLEVPQIELLILATTAENRLSLLKKIVQKTKVKKIILEKFLFQKVEDYFIANEIFKKNEINCWVNCPRRQWDFYKNLKENLNSEKIKKVKVHGSEWSMATSSIHFIDLISYLVEKKEYEILKTNFGKSFVPSYSIITGPRQSKFIEFYGTIEGQFISSTYFKFSCTQKDSIFSISLETDSKKIEIYEELGKCVFRNNSEKPEQKSEIDFKMPFQSEITNLIAEDIITKNYCSLTNYEDSMSLHLPLLKSYLTFLSEISKEKVTKCPIT